MWKPIYCNDNYLMKFDDIDRRLLLTNLKVLWIEQFTQETLISNFIEQNPLYVSDNESDTYNYIISILNNADNVQECTVLEDCCTIRLRTKLDVISMNFTTVLKQSDPDTFYREVTIKLIKTIQYLEIKERKQNDLLIAKDKEIQEYVIQNGPIKRTTLITEKYQPSENDNTQLLLNVFTKSNDFCEALKDKLGDIRQEFDELKDNKPEKRKLCLPNKLKPKKSKHSI